MYIIHVLYAATVFVLYYKVCNIIVFSGTPVLAFPVSS